MKKFQLSGCIKKEIENLPLVDIEAKNLKEAEEKYCEMFAKNKMKKDYVITITHWNDETFSKAVSDFVTDKD